MKNISISIMLAFMLMSAVNVFAIEVIVSGQVTDASTNEPIPGVSISVSGTSKGTITNLDGFYTIVLSDSSSSLVFSFIGYLNYEVEVESEDTVINVSLEADMAALEEVVVIGYATPKKVSLTGATSSVRIRGLASGTEVTSAKTVKSSAESEYINNANSGLLTAGELNDFSKWKLWNDISKKELNEFKEVWDVKPLERYTLQLKNHEGYPLIDASIVLHINDKLFWQCRTDNTGKAELWLNAFGKEELERKNLNILVNYDGQVHTLNKVKAFKKGLNVLVVNTDFVVPNKVEIAFIVDATGSMGDEINYLKSELRDIANKSIAMLPGKNIQFGTVFYRDKGDEYLTRHKDFTNSLKEAESFIKKQVAGGGGDFPEAVHNGLETMVNNLSWSDEALTRIAFLILDAPPHSNSNVVRSIEKSVREAAKKGIRLVPVTCSGIDKSTEYLMRSIALLTNGTYVFLTDDSGIGHAHIKPTTDNYEVEVLNDLIIRLVDQYTKVPDIQQNSNDMYAGELRDENDESECAQAALKTTDGTDDKIETSDVNPWKLFPNPCRGIMHVESRQGISEMQIYDYSGKLVIRKFFSDLEHLTVNLSDLSNGNYVVKLKGNISGWSSDNLIMVR